MMMLVVQSQHTASSLAFVATIATVRPHLSAAGISRYRHADRVEDGRAALVLQSDRGMPRRTPSAQEAE